MKLQIPHYLPCGGSKTFGGGGILGVAESHEFPLAFGKVGFFFFSCPLCRQNLALSAIEDWVLICF